MRTIYIMSGIPGCGKTHYVHANAGEDDTILSRDDYRAFLRIQHNTTEYFPVSAQEEYRTWAAHIRRTLKSTESNVWIDQTTLTQGALEKLINAIREALTPDDRIEVVMFDVPLNECLKRNSYRAGHENVPERTIKSMYRNMKQAGIDATTTARIFPDLSIHFSNNVYRITTYQGR